MAAVRIRALTTAPRIKPTSIFLRSARRPNPGRRSTYRRGIVVQTTGTGSGHLALRQRQQFALRKDHRVRSGKVGGKRIGGRRHDDDPTIFAAKNTARFPS